MNESMVKIGDKLVKLSRPYNPPDRELVGRENTLAFLRAAMRGGAARDPLYPLLVGEPGVGKNRIVYEISRMCSKELYVFRGNEDVRADDLSAGACISDDQNRRLDYMLSALVTAMIRGAICFMDEIGKIRQEGLSLLAGVLDESRSIQSLLLYDYIEAHPGFRFIAATNSNDLANERLPDWLLSRLKPVIHIDYPSREQVEKILKVHHPILKENGPLLDCFWSLWRKKNGNKPVSPRESIQLCTLAFNLADDESEGNPGRYELESSGICTEIREKHFMKAFDIFFPGAQDGGIR